MRFVWVGGNWGLCGIARLLQVPPEDARDLQVGGCKSLNGLALQRPGCEIIGANSMVMLG